MKQRFLGFRFLAVQGFEEFRVEGEVVPGFRNLGLGGLGFWVRGV